MSLANFLIPYGQKGMKSRWSCSYKSSVQIPKLVLQIQCTFVFKMYCKNSHHHLWPSGATHQQQPTDQ